MRSYNRERINDLLREQIAQIIDLEVTDPLVKFVTVTRVEASRDRRYATVYFSVYGDKKNQESSLEGLERATSFIRRKLARNASLRRVPELQFRYDRNIEYSAHIGQVLKRLKSDQTEEDINGYSTDS